MDSIEMESDLEEERQQERGREEEEESEDDDDHDEEQAISSLDRSVTVTLDPAVLDCAICLEPLSSPVYQCKEGHIACFCCCTKMSNKCTSCSLPIGYSRCRAIENVLESARFPFKFSKNGCKESTSYIKRQEREGGNLFMLINSPDQLGNSKITISFVGPSSEKGHMYGIVATYGYWCLKYIQTSPKGGIQQPLHDSQTSFLMIPKGFFDCSTVLKLDFLICVCLVVD